MRRLAALTAAALAIAALAVAIVLLVTSTGSGHHPYTVRAIFDDASFAAVGEDVRVAGANVGSISALAVTDHRRAAVTITIDNRDFAPFHANAHCMIRPQSLIGEEYVDCSPGTSSAAPLRRIAHGPGAGDHYLPVTRTSSPIDTDIVQDISTMPVRESLALIINELGTGLAARGADLNAVIHRAAPALGNTDRVLRILADQSHTLARLASSSAQVLGPLARERTQLAGFIASADTTARASASRAAQLEELTRRFPAFLRRLRPLVADLGTLAQQGTPVMDELGGSASALGRQFAQLTPFARAARTSLIDLGHAAAQAQPDLVATEPLARRLGDVGRQVTPSARSLASLLTSLDDSGGYEDLMTLLYRSVAVANGFDSLGHYVRVQPLTGGCTNYATHPTPGCSADFTNGQGTAARRSTADTDAITARAGRAAQRASASIVARALRSVAGSTGTQAPIGGLLSYLMGGTR